MKILAIDTATESCSAVLLLEGDLRQREAELERGHAEHILPMVDALLDEAGLRLEDLDALAFGRGPGGFTGVRMAASVAQGLAFGAGLRVVPVSDLAAVAQRALDLDSSVTRVVVCNDARMQEVYWGCFERGPDGLARAVGQEHVSPPAKVTLPAEWSGAPGGSVRGTVSEAAPGGKGVAGVGRGFRAYPVLREALTGAVTVMRDDLLPRAAEIARLAVPEVAAGRLLPPEEAIPVYLRDDVAHVRTPATPPSRK